MMKGRGMKITVSSMLLFAALLLPPLRSSAAADNTKTNVLV